MADDGTSSLQNNPLDYGKSLHGCHHYRRRCKVRAPCCNQIFSCRHCHNEYTNALANPKDRHEIIRHEIKQVICEICSTEQQVAQICANCGVKMGEYFCGICMFYDDDISKEQFHCDDCGICRVGGGANFFHCQKCGGSTISLTYIASERIIPGYGGGMSSAKAALESDTQVLAFEAGRKHGMRVNTISAGPLRSRATKAIGFIDMMIDD